MKKAWKDGKHRGNIGKKSSQKQREIASETMKKSWSSGKISAKTPWNKGKIGVQVAWNKGLNGFLAGEKHYFWQGGKSFEEYGVKFNNKLKEFIRTRDKYSCRECGISQKKLSRKLDVHHIDYDKKHNETNNLISLCNVCHSKTNFNRKDWTNYHSAKVLVEY